MWMLGWKLTSVTGGLDEQDEFGLAVRVGHLAGVVVQLADDIGHLTDAIARVEVGAQDLRRDKNGLKNNPAEAGL
jgi:hypothetical protein